MRDGLQDTVLTIRNQVSCVAVELNLRVDVRAASYLHFQCGCFVDAVCDRSYHDGFPGGQSVSGW